MREIVYEIKNGKHIAFRYKDKERFTRSKIIGNDYTEERLKERLSEMLQTKNPKVKQRVGRIINIKNNSKAKSSKGYEFWAKKHNLKTMADSIIAIRELGINSKQELEVQINKSSENRQNIL